MSTKRFVLAGLLLLSSFCMAQTIDNSILARQDFKSTTNNTVTVTSYMKNDTHYIYSGGDGGTIDVFSINNAGILSPISSHELYNRKGPVRGLVADNINGTDYLFAGNKGGNAVEVFQIQDDGSLNRVFVLNDTDETYLGIVITLQVIHMKKAAYLFVGGLEETPGLSCFKIHDDGSLTHVQSVKDDGKIHTDGIIGMYVHKINGKTFLYTGGFQDNGLSSFRVYDNGHFKNVSNIDDNNTDRYLTGTYPVTGVTLAGNHYVVVGHRHHKYYQRKGFIKKTDFIYHGDAVSVFKTNEKGELIPHFILKDYEKTMLSGQTRIEILTADTNKAIVAIGTRDDESIQLCTLDKDGILTPISYLKTGFPIYYGLNALKIGNDYFVISGSVAFNIKRLIAYKIVTEELNTADKVIRHVVSFKFKANASKENIDQALANFENLKNEIPEIADFEWGTNDSTEGLSKGFTHCFTLTFNDMHAREIYVFHKAHLEAGKNILPILDDVFVMDYWTD